MFHRGVSKTNLCVSVCVCVSPFLPTTFPHATLPDLFLTSLGMVRHCTGHITLPGFPFSHSLIPALPSTFNMCICVCVYPSTSSNLHRFVRVCPSRPSGFSRRHRLSLRLLERHWLASSMEARVQPQARRQNMLSDPHVARQTLAPQL